MSDLTWTVDAVTAAVKQAPDTVEVTVTLTVFTEGTDTHDLSAAMAAVLDEVSPDAVAQNRRLRGEAMDDAYAQLAAERDAEPVLITHDVDADAAYVYLTGADLAPGRDTVEVDTPRDVAGPVLLDFKDGRLVGVEVLNASRVLHPDLLATANDGLSLDLLEAFAQPDGEPAEPGILIWHDGVDIPENACLACGHSTDGHSGGGIGVCMQGTCGCDGHPKNAKKGDN